MAEKPAAVADTGDNASVAWVNSPVNFSNDWGSIAFGPQPLRTMTSKDAQAEADFIILSLPIALRLLALQLSCIYTGDSNGFFPCPHSHFDSS